MPRAGPAPSARRTSARFVRATVQGTRDAGYTSRMDAEVLVTDVKRVETRSGKTRWVLTDDAGK